MSSPYAASGSSGRYNADDSPLRDKNMVKGDQFGNIVNHSYFKKKSTNTSQTLVERST